MPAKPGVLLSVGAGGLIFIAAGLWLTQKQGSEASAIQVTAGQERLVTKDAGLVEAHNSPTIVQNPIDADALAVVNKVDRPSFSTSLHVSSDAGRTWTTVPFPAPPGEKRPYAPDLAWGPDGTLFMSFVTLFGPGNSPEAVWITSSDDGGRGWAQPRRVVGPEAFQVRLAIDDNTGELYLTWLQASKEAVKCINCFATTGLPILISRSSDGGGTWTDPVQVSSSGRERIGAPVAVVGPQGDVYVLYFDFKDDRVNWENLEGDYDGTYELVLASSGDGVFGWTEHVVEQTVVPDGRFLPYLPEFPSLAVDAEDGTLYAAWTDAGSGDDDVLVSRSTDSGDTWSNPVAVHGETTQRQYLPDVEVGTAGHVGVAYLDRSGDPDGVLTMPRFALSADSGGSWSSVVLSTEPFSSRLGPRSAVSQEVDQGTRLGLTIGTAQAFVAWTDSRRSDKTTGRLDVFFAPVSLEPG